MIELLLVALIALACFGLGYKIGSDVLKVKCSKQEEDPPPVVKKKRKPSYNPADLLDPVTPLEQRIEANTVEPLNFGGVSYE